MGFSRHGAQAPIGPVRDPGGKGAVTFGSIQITANRESLGISHFAAAFVEVGAKQSMAERCGVLFLSLPLLVLFILESLHRGRKGLQRATVHYRPRFDRQSGPVGSGIIFATTTMWFYILICALSRTGPAIPASPPQLSLYGG